VQDILILPWFPVFDLKAIQQSAISGQLKQKTNSLIFLIAKSGRG